MFLGTFINKIDKKGRVSIPASFRSSTHIGKHKNIIAFCSFRLPCIEVCDWTFFCSLKEQMNQLDLFSQEHDDFMAVIFGEAQAFTFDAEGRIVFPSTFFEHASIEDQASFVGVGDMFQIWNPNLWNQHKRQAKERLKNQKISLKRSLYVKDNEA